MKFLKLFSLILTLLSLFLPSFVLATKHITPFVLLGLPPEPSKASPPPTLTPLRTPSQSTKPGFVMTTPSPASSVGSTQTTGSTNVVGQVRTTQPDTVAQPSMQVGDKRLVNTPQLPTLDECPEGVYCLLEPIPGSPGTPEIISVVTGAKAGTPNSFSDYLKNILKFILFAIGIFSVVMFVWAGIQYIGSGTTITKIEDAKAQATAVVTGVLILAASYMILNTINPDLVNFELNIPPLGQQETEPRVIKTSFTAQEPLPQRTADPNAGDPQRVDIRTDSSYNLPVSKRSNAGVNKDLAAKLVLMDLSLKQSGVSWQITEAWPPVGTHRSRCHQTGECVDLNLGDKEKRLPIKERVAKLNSVFTAADRAGLTSLVYEVKTPEEMGALRRAGLTENLKLVVNKEATAAHFHVNK